MQFTEFQQDRIKRFFLAVSVLAANPEMRMNSQEATRVLRVTSDRATTPPESLPSVPVLITEADFFVFIAQYGARDRACAKVFRILLTAAVAIGGYAFYAGGLAPGFMVLVGALVGAFILNLVVMRSYVVRGFSPMRYGLTPTEVHFALEVVADPLWQRNNASEA